MPLRQTLQWMLILLATIVIVVGGGVIWLWGHSETLLKQEITLRLEQLAPDLPLEFEKASFETDGRVRVTEISLQSPDHASTLLRLPELIGYLDRELFVKHRQVSLLKLVINRPRVTLEQSADGGWSFQGLKVPKPGGMAWPEVELLDGEILLLAHRDALVPLELRLKNLDAHLKPTAKGQCEIAGHGDLDPIGPVEIEGELDTSTGRWNIRARARRIPAGDQLIDVASELSSAVKTKVDTITQAVREKTRHPAIRALDAQSTDTSDGVQVASLQQGEPGPADPTSLIPRIGLRADLDLQCEIACEGFGEPIDYAADLKIENGEVTDLFPIPLYEVSGRVLLRRDRVEIQKLKAVNGDSLLMIDGMLPLAGNQESPDLKVRATNLPVDHRIRDHVTPKLRQLLELHQPEGRFDLDVEYAPDRSPPVFLREFRVRDGSMLHDQFRYPIQSISGTIVQDKDRYLFDMRGTASGHAGTLTGFMRGFDPDSEADLRIQAQGFPIDDVLVAAFETPKLKAIATTMRAMQIHGEGDVDVSFRRSPQTGPKFLTFLDMKFRNSEVNYYRFPLPLSNVSGQISHDPLHGNIWHFKDMSGFRGETKVTGQGTYETQDGIGNLNLEFNATDVPIDATLKAASLNVNDRLQEVWNQLNPSAGILEFQNLQIEWSPGQSPRVTMPVIKVQGAALRLAAVPYPLDRVSGLLSWDGQSAVVDHLEGWHGSTFAKVSSTADKPGPYFQLNPAAGIDWRLHLPEISLRKISFDDELRQALPDSIQAVVLQLDPRGPVDLDIGLDFKQFRSPKPLVTASFQVDATLKGNRLNAGVTLDQANGHITLINGSWDGQMIAAEGYAKLESVRVWDLPLYQLEGPFSILGNRINAGSPPAGSPEPYSKKNPYANREIVASLYDGKVSVNAEAIINSQNPANTVYNAEVNLQNAKLEQWAKQQGSSQRLRGPVNGKLTLSGKGPSPLAIVGQGYVDVTQAQLYELPVLVRVFALQNLRTPDDNKAFRYGFADFQLRQGIFDFTEIRLVGDAVNLVGRGFVGFAGEQDRHIGFDFYTDARNRIPVIGPIVEMVGSGWVRVRVDGTIDNAKATTGPRVPILDEAFGGLIQSLESGQMQTPPTRPSAGLPQRPRR